MIEGARIADQLRRMMYGPAWHGPSVLESLDGLAAAVAAAHPVPGAHSIWELVAHLEMTQRIILARFRGETPAATETDYFPPVVETTDDAWRALITRLRAQEDELIAVARALPDDRLETPLASGSIPYDNLHGHAQHNAFHAGQIRLLRKLLGA